MRPTALVTGAARGIGRAIVDTLVDVAWVGGVDIVFGDDLPPANRTHTADVSRSDAIEAAVQSIVSERNGLDWVVCAAGIVRDRVSWKMSDAQWKEVIDVNLTGAFNTVRASAPHLRLSQQGRVVFVGSINGSRGRFGQANYAAAKAGLVGLARSMALELSRDRVTVNVVAPGFIDTEMTRALPEAARRHAVARTPLGRKGQPQEVAAAVRFLCGPDAGFITGAVVPIDGGQLLGEVG